MRASSEKTKAGRKSVTTGTDLCLARRAPASYISAVTHIRAFTRVYAHAARAAMTTLVAHAVLAQTAAAPRRLYLVPDNKVDVSRVGGGGPNGTIVAIGPDGRTVLAPANNWGGQLLVFDSAGAALPWALTAGRGDSADIGIASRVGWLNGTGTMWIGDPMYRQIALVDGQGKVLKSVENASWIHPTWSERHLYPIYGTMEPLAVYADQTMLVLPGRERSLISTPTFDKSVTHLFRTTLSGAIQRTVATVPTRDVSRIDLRSAGVPAGPGGRGMSFRSFVVPFVPRTFWSVSSDGLRIAVAAYGVTPADSGTVRVTMLNDHGDTVYNRRYPYVAARVGKDRVEQYLSGVRGLDPNMAARLRDSVTNRVPLFQSFLTGLFVGHDHSAWVLLRPASDTAKEQRALVLDARGDVAGVVDLPADENPAAVSLDRLWTLRPGGRGRGAGALVRYLVRTTAAPPSRTQPAAASSPPPRPPR